MTSKNISNALLRTLFILSGIVFLGYIIGVISSVLIYVIVAILLSFVAQPISDFLQKKLRFPPILAIIVSLTLFIVLAFDILLLFVPLIVSQSKNLALLDMVALEKNSVLFLNQVDVWLQTYDIQYKKLIDIQKITQTFNFNFITDILNSIIGSIGNFGMAIFSIFFICFFLLKDQKLITTNLRAVLPANHRWRILASLLRIKNMLSKYTIGLLTQLLLVFVMYLIVLLFFGVENAFIIAFLGAILNIIPYIGPIIALVMTAFLTILGHIHEDFQLVVMPTTLYVIIGYFVVQLIDNNVSQPFIFSKSTNSHPLEIFLVTLISGTLLGILGMIIAIPFYTALKVVLKEFYPKSTFIQIVTKGL